MDPSTTSVLIYHEFILFKILITEIIDTITELRSYQTYANLWKRVKDGIVKDPVGAQLHTLQHLFYDSISRPNIRHRFVTHYTWTICSLHDPPNHKHNIKETVVYLDVHFYKMKALLLYADGSVQSIYQSRAIFEAVFNTDTIGKYDTTQDTNMIRPLMQDLGHLDPIQIFDRAIPLKNIYNNAVRSGHLDAINPAIIQVNHYHGDSDNEAGLNDL